jgi:hypothetical protein
VAVNRCFFDGMLQGRPVEMVMITDVTRQPVVFRFDGSGFVTRYMQEGGDGSTSRAWYRRDGCEILGSSVYWGLECGAEPVRLD